ncbi:MAG TPA: hypothetical protein DEP05_03170, partial [Betaproteobacteria bacterium]|nr:hypothetical protein [Betaproteobacteria bacterium]
MFKRMAQGWILASLLISAAALADGALLKPFILASNGPGTVAAKAAAAKKALQANGFTIAGTYSPYANAEIIIVTNAALKNNAAQSPMGGFGAMQRVAVTQVKNAVQVSYTNPVYMANAYRMKGDLKGVAAALRKALGEERAFGAHGMSADALRHYHYMFGMEYFTDPSTLAEYSSHDAAVKALEKGLAAGRSGVTQVYRIDIPGKRETVFGVAMRSAANKYQDDRYIMHVIDFKPLKSTAYLPYEILV